jgi:ornithine cyclodeaminase/alanine dehydrogenase-like protein (mu-crystallin family)
MIRYLTESDVKQLLTMPDALEQVERGLKDRALGRAVDVPRVRTHVPAGTQHVMQAASHELRLIGYKAYYSCRGKGTRFFVHVFNMDSGTLEAIIQASYLGMVRTGAASGAATRYLARKNAAVVAMIGAGKQAVGQLEAVCGVRSIREVRVYSRTEERARKFCEVMKSKVGAQLRTVANPADAVRGADIVNVITNAANPVLKGEWLESGQHVNAAGSNSLIRREIDEAAVGKCGVIAVDSRNTAQNECGDLLPAVEKGSLQWEALPEIGEIMLQRLPGRASDDQITLYESHGMAVQDLYVGARVLQLARERGVGADFPIGD